MWKKKNQFPLYVENLYTKIVEKINQKYCIKTSFVEK